jgi:hypothetical protein
MSWSSIEAGNVFFWGGGGGGGGDYFSQIMKFRSSLGIEMLKKCYVLKM